MNVVISSAKKLMAFFVKHRMRTTRGLFVLLAFLILFTRPIVLPYSLLGILFDWIGYFFIILACLGRVFSSVFISGTKNQQLSTQGPYSMVRNPLYVFSFFGTMGLGFLSCHVVILALVVLLFLMYYPEVVKKEEAFLWQKFGKEYEDYKKNVPRWVPRHFTLNLPTTFTVYPAILLSTIRDSSLFFIILPLVQLVNILQDTHMIKTVFRLL